MAASLASVPELAKNTRPRPVLPGVLAPSRLSSRSASATSPSCTNRLEVWARSRTCLLTASMIAGWACPSELTAIPANMSVYSRPSASQTRHPSPRASASAGMP